jgi:cysteinyl-tRNA synthetase
VLPPDHEPRATDYVPQMLDLIGLLEDKGLAYRAAGGDVNFAVRRFPGYGKLSGKSLDELRAGERVAVQDDKDDPLDFVLWKAAKPDEPAEAKWDSPGARPAGLAHRVLGDELRAARRTLRHPRRRHGPAVPAPRERDRAERGRERRPFVRLDAQRLPQRRRREDVQVAGQLLHHRRRAAQRFDGETLRLFMLRTHYRSPFNFSDALLDDARSALRGCTRRSTRCRPRRRRRLGRARGPPPSARRWTTTSTRRRRGGAVRAGRRGSTAAATPAAERC